MEHARGKHRIRASGHGRGKVLRPAGPATRNHRDRDGGADQTNQLEVETVLGPVGVHRIEQNLPGAEFGRGGRPRDRVDPGAVAAAMGRHLEAARGGPAARRDSTSVHRQDEHLPSEAMCDFAEKLRTSYRRRVHADLVRTGPQQPIHVGACAYAPADGQRDEYLFGGPPHDLICRFSAGRGRRDVEECQLVGTLGVVATGQLDGVSCVPQPDEVHAFDDASRVDVQARDHADGNGHERAPITVTGGRRRRHLPRSRRACAGRSRPTPRPSSRPAGSRRMPRRAPARTPPTARFGDEHARAHDVGQRATDPRECRTDVLDRLPGLCGRLSGVDYFAVCDRRAPAYEHEIPGPNDSAVANQLLERPARSMPPDVAHLGILLGGRRWNGGVASHRLCLKPARQSDRDASRLSSVILDLQPWGDGKSKVITG